MLHKTDLESQGKDAPREVKRPARQSASRHLDICLKKRVEKNVDLTTPKASKTL